MRSRVQSRRAPTPSAQQQLEMVRDMLERMVAWRLLYPFNAEEARRFNRLTAKELRLLDVLAEAERLRQTDSA